MACVVNIISINVPYPPDYGGAIDIYYKLKALHDAGVEVILHTFCYDRPQSPHLENICKKVYYYPRKRGIKRQFSFLPYIVNSRTSKQLLDNLCLNPYPILFEGLHVCRYLGHPLLKDRKKLVRMANIEHHYYYHLFKAERNFKKKLYFLVESLRLKLYQPILKNAQTIYGISTSETAYLTHRFGKQKVKFLPCFHPNSEVTAKEGKGSYILYHANLSVPENEQAALWLTEHVFSKLDFPAIVAGKKPSAYLKKKISGYGHISLIADPSEEEMGGLIRNAQLHTLVTFQSTGLKLKLLNTLFRGRFCLVNPSMVEGSGLESLCRVAGTKEEFGAACRELTGQEFTPLHIEQRRDILSALYDNRNSIKTLLEDLYPENS